MASIGSTPVFTTTEAVRASVGIDQVDLPDARLLDAQFDLELRIDFSSWYPGALTALVPAEPVGVEAALLRDTLQMFCKYFCALRLASSPLTFIQLYSDGKAEQRRFTNFDWAEMAANFGAKLETYRSAVIAQVPGEVTWDSSTAQLIGISTPNYNPITNTEGGA